MADIIKLGSARASDFDRETVEQAYDRWAPVYDLVFGGVFSKGRHFVSHLEGDLDQVLGSIRRTFDQACESAGHVTAHITLSANSPTRKAA